MVPENVHRAWQVKHIILCVLFLGYCPSCELDFMIQWRFKFRVKVSFPYKQIFSRDERESFVLQCTISYYPFMIFFFDGDGSIIY